MWKFFDVLLGKSSDPKPNKKKNIHKKLVEVVGPRACMRNHISLENVKE